MTFIRGATAVAVRVAAVTVFYLVYVALLSRTDGTDALGAGLLFFLIVSVVALVWAVIDAIRHGFVPAVAVWACVALLSGVALSIGYVLTNDGSKLSEEIGTDLPFFALLVFVPALAGAAAGAIVHRMRRPAQA